MSKFFSTDSTDEYSRATNERERNVWELQSECLQSYATTTIWVYTMNEREKAWRFYFTVNVVVENVHAHIHIQDVFIWIEIFS